MSRQERIGVGLGDDSSWKGARLRGGYRWCAAMFLLVLSGVGCYWELWSPSATSVVVLFNVGGDLGPVEVAGESVFRERSVFEEIPGKVGSHAGAVTCFSDGELLAAWYSYAGPHELDGSAIYMARRAGGSEDWGEPWLHIDRPEGDGNPVLYSEGERVWLFSAVAPFGWATARIEMQQSNDRGRTWSSPTIVTGVLGSNVRFGPLRTSDGSLLLPAYSDLVQRSLFFSSIDGVTWVPVASVLTEPPHRNIQPSVARLSSGRLLAVMRNIGRDWMWVMASDDDGRSWSKPIDSGFPNCDSPSALVRLASGNLILVFNDSTSERRPLSIALSGDEGMTWPHRRVLADGPSSYSYPAAVQTPDGLIQVLYSHGRQNIRHATVSESWIVSEVK